MSSEEKIIQVRGENPFRRILDIFYYAYQQCDINTLLKRSVEVREGVLLLSEDKFPLDQYEKIYIAGIGIAAFDMVSYFVGILQNRVSVALALVPPGFGGKSDKILVREVTSPLLDTKSQKALRDLIFIMKKAKEKDLVILLLSKGTSEALELLHEGISFSDYNLLIKALKKAGATSEEINSVKMHLSALKGGGFLTHLYPATVISLILSDEPGGDISRTFLAPTYYDPTTFHHCRDILIRYKLPLKLPAGILNVLNGGMRGKIPETLKKGDKRLSRCHNFVLCHCGTFAADALDKMEQENINSTILSTHIEADPYHFGKLIGSVCKDIHHFGIPIEPPCGIIFSGRLEDSENDRLEKLCQLALSVAISIDGMENFYFLAGTSFQFEKRGTVGCIVSGKTASELKKHRKVAIDIVRSGQSLQTLQGLGLTFEAPFNPVDCGDLFILMAF